MRPIRCFALIALACAAPAAAQDAPYVTSSCPVPDAVPGYPVWVAAAEGTAPLDSAFARAVADAAARRWLPPSRGRGRHQGMEMLGRRILTPEPRWPDDWEPGARHVARVEATLRADGRVDARVAAPSGDRGFDRTLPDVFERPAPASPAVPALPPGLDSARVVIGFGGAPPAGAQAVRFAAQQDPVRIVPGTLTVNNPPEASRMGQPSATVAYDVDENGRIDPASIRFLASSNRDLEHAIRTGLVRARFTAARSNCRPVAQTVVQRFGR